MELLYHDSVPNAILVAFGTEAERVIA